MPKVTEQHALARRQQIIDAAYRCFARKGFHQTSMRDIYAEAELSPGAVYHYFDSKDAIIAASFDFDYQRSMDLLQSALDSDDPLTTLSDLLAFLFNGLQGAAALGAGRVNVQGWGEALINPPLLQSMRRILDSYRDVTKQIIRKAQARGRLNPALDPLALCNVLLSLYYGLELQVALDAEFDVDAYAETVKVLLNGIAQQPQ